MHTNRTAGKGRRAVLSPQTPPNARSQSVRTKVTVDADNSYGAAHDISKAEVESVEEHALLPMTPKSPVSAIPLPPDIDEKTSSSRNVAHRNTARDELLGTMKQMLGALGCSFDTVGEQIFKVATLPIAIDAMNQVS